MLLLNYGFYEFWQNYQHKVTFDGINKTIIVNNNILLLDFKIDVYSAWKQWAMYRDNTKYALALSVVGGDPTVGGSSLGSTFFLENGWKMRTWEGDHRLVVQGNAYTRDGSSLFVPTINSHNIVISQQVSNLIDKTATTIAPSDNAAIASQVRTELSTELGRIDVPISSVSGGSGGSGGSGVATANGRLIL